jgi:predicted RNA-binding Zn ribbon-like protein
MGDPATMLLVGGHAALDFVNTLGGLPNRPDDEYLHSYPDLITWCRRTDLLPAAEETRLIASGRNDPDEARRVLTSAKELRGALDGVLRARLGRQQISADDLGSVGRFFAVAVARGHLQASDTGLRWTWPTLSQVDLEAPLWPTAVSAVDLLDKTALDLLRRCHHCRWLFLDTSRNRTRRWCSMNACGGTDKMRRHRARLRSAQPTER